MRFVTLIVMPLLAGVGLYTVTSWLPGPWDIVALMVLAGGVVLWSIHEMLWARRTSRELLRRTEELQARLNGDR